MAQLMQCDIVTPEEMAFSTDKAVIVSFPSVEGEIGVMYNHAPLVAMLDRGETRIETEDGEVHRFMTALGYAEVNGSKVILMANRCVRLEDVDIEEVKANLAEHEARLDSLEEGSSLRKFSEMEMAWDRKLIALLSR